MPYIRCSNCQMISFTVARYSTRDGCPGCGSPIALEVSRRRELRPRLGAGNDRLRGVVWPGSPADSSPLAAVRLAARKVGHRPVGD